MDYEKNQRFEKAIAFDFLGVLVKHDGKPFVSEERYLELEPNSDVVEAMKALKEKGYKIILHSTIADSLLEEYCSKFQLPVDEINKNSEVKNGNAGKPVVHLYIDDRAFQYRGQSSEELVKEIEDFKPYWKS